MKAMIYKTYGTPDALELANVAKPTPRVDEGLVKIKATAVNQADRHLLRGSLRFSSGLFKPKHQILGSDIAGLVEAIGSEVTQFQVGDAVFGDLSEKGRGGFAEYVTAPETALALKPANLSFAAAAAAPMTAVTALQGLRDKGNLQPGQQVLINGASGGVGTFAVQIAKALGAEVTAVGSTRNRGLMAAIGADHIIDYKKEDFTKNGKLYDLIFDAVANHSVSAYKQVLQPRGRYVSAAFSMSALLLGPWIALTEGKKMGNMLARPNQEDLRFIAKLLETEQITPVIDRCYSLSAVPDALRYLEDGHAAGKVIIMVDDFHGSNHE